MAASISVQDDFDSAEKVIIIRIPKDDLLSINSVLFTKRDEPISANIQNLANIFLQLEQERTNQPQLF